MGWLEHSLLLISYHQGLHVMIIKIKNLDDTQLSRINDIDVKNFPSAENRSNISFECCCALLPSWRDLSGRNRFFNKKDMMFCQRSGKRILHKSDKRLSIKLCQQNVRVFGPTPFPVRPRGMRLGLIYSNKSFLIISAFGHTLSPLCGNVHNGCLLMTTRDK